MFKKREITRIDCVRKDADLVGRILTGLGIEVEDLNPNGQITCLRVKAPKDAIKLLMENLLLEGDMNAYK